MSTPVHVTIGTNECGGVGFTRIKNEIEMALSLVPMEIDLKVHAVVFSRTTGAILPAAHADDLKKLEAVQELARRLKANPIPGAIGLASTMLASRLLEILRGDL